MKFKSLVEARAHQRAISQMVTRAYGEIGAEMTSTPLSEQEVNWDNLTMFGGDTADTETRMMKLSSIVGQLKEAGEEVTRLSELSNISVGAEWHSVGERPDGCRAIPYQDGQSVRRGWQSHRHSPCGRHRRDWRSAPAARALQHG